MIQAQINGTHRNKKQALKCRICGNPITNNKEKTYLSAGLKRGRAAHKKCKTKVKQQ